MAVSTTRSNPPTVREPTGYTHAIEIRNPERWLVISGQVGMALDGTIPDTGGGQITQALANLRAVLEANDMTRDQYRENDSVSDRPVAAGCLSRRADRFFGRARAGIDAAVRRGSGGSPFRGGDRGSGGGLTAAFVAVKASEPLRQDGIRRTIHVRDVGRYARAFVFFSRHEPGRCREISWPERRDRIETHRTLAEIHRFRLRFDRRKQGPGWRQTELSFHLVFRRETAHICSVEETVR